MNVVCKEPWKDLFANFNLICRLYIITFILLHSFYYIHIITFILLHSYYYIDIITFILLHWYFTYVPYLNGCKVILFYKYFITIKLFILFVYCCFYNKQSSFETSYYKVLYNCCNIFYHQSLNWQLQIELFKLSYILIIFRLKIIQLKSDTDNSIIIKLCFCCKSKPNTRLYIRYEIVSSWMLIY